MEEAPKGRCTLIMRGGQTIVLKCRKVETERNRDDGVLTRLTVDGILGQKFTYLRLEDVSAVLWDVEE